MKNTLLFVGVFLSACFMCKAQDTTRLSLDDAIKVALSENASVKVADKEIERVGYAKKGTYASLFPQVDISGSYQRTIKKQVMYMDITGGSSSQAADQQGDPASSSGQMPGMPSGGSGGIEVGRSNTFSAGVSAAMPLINVALWRSLKISGQEVELAVEKARNSRLDMVSQVKNAFYTVLLAKEAYFVYKEVYINAVKNFEQTERKFNAQRASELDLTRAQAAVASAIPSMYAAESDISLALWQLKAVMGLNLDELIDVKGKLGDYADNMLQEYVGGKEMGLEDNSTLKQLAIQAEELATTIKLQKAAYAPTLSLAFNYAYNAMSNNFKFSEYKWAPYSYAALSLSIPIFSGGKRLNNVRQTKVQAEELEIQKTNTERQLKIAIQQYVNQMEAAMKSYAAAESAVEMAEKAYSIAEMSYNVGRSTLTDLNDAQLALSQSRLNRSQTVYTFVIAKAGLEQVLGVDYVSE